MPSIFGHGLTGLTLGYLARHRFENLNGKKIILLTIVAATLPDFDVIFHHLGLDQWASLHHRGFFHSIVFALMTTPLFSVLPFRQNSPRQKWALSFLFFGVIMSHSILDAFTIDAGVAFLEPFTHEMFNWPWTPLGQAGFSLEEFQPTALREFLVLWLPLMTTCVASWMIHKRK